MEMLMESCSASLPKFAGAVRMDYAETILGLSLVPTDPTPPMQGTAYGKIMPSTRPTTHHYTVTLDILASTRIM